MRLDESQGHVFFTHGITQDAGTQDWCYVIDSDFSIEEQTDVNDAVHRLDQLNVEARRFFRWCIQPRLHDAMQPEPV
jgi:uncharacterized protein (TIGR04255 family)